MRPHAPSARRVRPGDWRLLARLWPLTRPYRGALAAGVGLMAVGAFGRMAGPYLVKLAIDGPVTRADAKGLAWLAALYLLVQAGVGAVEAGQTVLLRTRGERILRDLRERLFAKALRLPMGRLDRTPAGTVVSRVSSDVAVLSDLFSAGLVGVLGDIVLVLGILAVLFRLHAGLALTVLAVFPVLLVASEWIRRGMREAYRSAREATSRLTAAIHEHLRGAEVVRLFGARAWSLGQVEERGEENLRAQVRSVTLQALFFPLVELFSALTLALVLWRGAGFAAGGGLTFGALVAFFEYVQRLFRPLRDVGERVNVLQASLAAAERITGFLDEPSEAPGGRARPPIRGEVVFDGVTFGYGDGDQVLQGFDLVVRPGESVALVGPTGSGKTTAVHLLLGFYLPRAGEIRIDGTPRPRLDPEWFARHVALVPQDPVLLRDTVFENIRLGREWVGPAQVEAAARAVGLHEMIEELPAGYETLLGEEGAGLSSGQRQLVAFARALAGDPRILILDEATSEVDQATEAQIEEALAVLLEGRTSLVVAHRLSTVRRVDRIAVLRRGRVVEQGSHDELLGRGGWYRSLYELNLLRA
ncbi:ABC transporter ATP-binding protein [Deferrisoma sp.]